jgi:hypothetical protein
MAMLREEKFNLISDLLNFDLIKNGVSSVIFADLAGNVLIEAHNDGHRYDAQSLASLAAGNFLTVSTLLNYLEDTELTLLFHKGKSFSIHFKKILNNYLLISIFDKDISLGFLRLKIGKLEPFLESNLS